MSETQTELLVVVCDSVISLPLFATYDFHRGIPAQTTESGEPPSAPEEPEHVEITSAWTNLPMQSKPSGSPHKPTFKYNLLPMMSEEQIQALEEKILEEHEEK